MRSTRSHPRSLVLLAVAGALVVSAPLGSAAADAGNEPTSVRWNGRSFETAYELRRHLTKRGADFERFLRGHPRIAAGVGLQRVPWGGRGFYTMRAMRAWLGARGRRYADWQVRNPAQAKKLARNRALSMRARPTISQTPTVTQTPRGRRPKSDDAYGIAAGGNMHNLSDAELARELDAYRAAGSRWVRVDINWSLIQRGGPASFEWEPFDRVVRAARARDLRVLAGVLYTPEWARPGTPHSSYPPADLTTYAEFCRAAVEHYAPLGVHHWEIWNEPNVGFWRPAPDPARYAQMLRLAYPAIKGADRKALVVSAGLAPYGAYGQAGDGLMNPLTFLERMYAAGAGGSFDALGWHPYNFGGLFYHPSSAWSQLAETSPSVRSIMTANGDAGKQVWATEFGAPTGASSDAVQESAQARLVTEGYTKWQAWDWSGPLFWYSFRDLGLDARDREQNFGLLRYDFSPKPSFDAYRALATG